MFMTYTFRSKFVAKVGFYRGFSTTGVCKLNQSGGGGKGYYNKTGVRSKKNYIIAFFSSVFARDKLLKHLTLFNVVFGLFVIMVTGIIKESGLAVFLLSFFRVNVSEVYS